MTNLANPAALIAKLEQATEGSRALSDECLLAVGWVHIPESRGTKDGKAWQSPECWFENQKQHKRWLPYYGSLGRPLRPTPTLSLDDAIRWMTPEGWGWAAAILDKDMPSAVVTNYEPQLKPGTFDPNPDKIDFRAKAGTPALALCIASLKARIFKA